MHIAAEKQIESYARQLPVARYGSDFGVQLRAKTYADLFDLNDQLEVPLNDNRPTCAGLIALGCFGLSSEPVAIPFLQSPSQPTKKLGSIGLHETVFKNAAVFAENNDFHIAKDVIDLHYVRTFTVKHSGEWFTTFSTDSYQDWVKEAKMTQALRRMSKVLPNVEFCINTDKREWMIVRRGKALMHRTSGVHNAS